MSPAKPVSRNYAIGGTVTSALAALYALPAGAGIVHIDTPLTTVSTNTGGFSDVLWDVDADSSNSFGADFVLKSNSSYVVQLDSQALNGLGVVQNDPTGDNQSIRNLPVGATVGPSLSAGYRFGPSGIVDRTILSNGNISSVDAPSFVFGDNFIGFSFDAGGKTLYGWARIELVLDPLNTGNQTQASLTIAEWAYENSGAAIQVGATSVDEPAPLALLALGAGGLATWRRRRDRATVAVQA